jgi:chlorite dismutase
MLTPEFAYFSVTEASEYEPAATGTSSSLGTENWDPLKPALPGLPVICFYPMSHRRTDGHNWYELDLPTRKSLMQEHAKVRESHASGVRHLITASSGLDDMEWGVTLFAQSTSQIKDMVHKMRYDAVNAKYTDFGACFIGLQLPLDALFHRLGL